MKYIFRIITCLILCCFILLAGCTHDLPDSDDTPEPSQSVEPPSDDRPIEQQSSFTLLLYVCGSDLESRFGAASKNIVEMQEAEIDENVNVILQTGGSKSWNDSSISAQSTDRYLIKDGKKQLIDRNTVKQNMGSSQTLADFITFGVEQYPADQYGLILWNHGAGSIKGVCFDANFGNDALTLLEIKEALASVKDSMGKKFEFVGFDACLMATYDMACILEPYANYMIASEELEPSSGWDYKALISSLGKDTFYTDVLNAYAEAIREEYRFFSFGDAMFITDRIEPFDHT